MEPPSPQLGSLLAELQLASPRELRRCRPIVRRLARDLPTFDSVWIDALTQTRVLTPFQARILESDQPQRLRVGPCVLVDEWERDGRWTLCVARHRGSRRQCLLTYVHVPSDQRPRACENVRRLLQSLRGLSHPSILVPQGCDESAEQLIVVSPFASGPTLEQLLIRRGRFPIPIVREIARQLVDGLAALEQCGTCHGDLRLNAVRLTRRGQTILLNPGVLPAIGSRISFHDGLSADCYDGIAPELISTGATANCQSDLYALGCLLWQLLAGRPPFPTGDPLGKLAGHQSRSIDDVRRWRPDVPDDLARLISTLTIKAPVERPSGPREVRDTLRMGGHGGRTRLSSFHASFGTVAPRRGDSHRSAARFPWPAAATLLFVLSGVALGLLDAGARNELLRLASRVTDSSPAELAQVPTGQTARRSGTPETKPLPTTPSDGTITLAEGETYFARDLRSDRPLTILCTGQPATIIVGDQPWRITAQSVQLTGLRLVTTGPQAVKAKSPTTPPPVLVAIRAQQVAVERCQFETLESSPLGTAIAWKIPDEMDPSGGRFVARHSTVLGNLRGLDLHAMPRIIGFDNCLKHGTGPLIRLNSGNQKTPLRVHLRQSTLRDTGTALQWATTAATERLQPALLVFENTVVAPQGSDRGLLDFAGNAPVGWERMLQLTGEGSLLHPGSPLVTDHTGIVDSTGLRVEGLLIDEFEFAGSETTIAASAVRSTQGPRSSPTPPGINPAHFETSSAAPVVRQASAEYNAH